MLSSNLINQFLNINESFTYISGAYSNVYSTYRFLHLKAGCSNLLQHIKHISFEYGFPHLFKKLIIGGFVCIGTGSSRNTRLTFFRRRPSLHHHHPNIFQRIFLFQGLFLLFNNWCWDLVLNSATT